MEANSYWWSTDRSVRPLLATMLSCTASELRLSGRFDVNRVDDVEELFDHRHLLVHEVDLTVDGLEQKETKLFKNDRTTASFYFSYFFR